MKGGDSNFTSVEIHRCREHLGQAGTGKHRAQLRLLPAGFRQCLCGTVQVAGMPTVRAEIPEGIGDGFRRVELSSPVQGFLLELEGTGRVVVAGEGEHRVRVEGCPQSEWILDLPEQVDGLDEPWAGLLPVGGVGHGNVSGVVEHPCQVLLRSESAEQIDGLVPQVEGSRSEPTVRHQPRHLLPRRPFRSSGPLCAPDFQTQLTNRSQHGKGWWRGTTRARSNRGADTRQLIGAPSRVPTDRVHRPGRPSRGGSHTNQTSRGFSTAGSSPAPDRLQVGARIDVIGDTFVIGEPPGDT